MKNENFFSFFKCCGLKAMCCIKFFHRHFLRWLGKSLFSSHFYKLPFFLFYPKKLLQLSTVWVRISILFCAYNYYLENLHLTEVSYLTKLKKIETVGARKTCNPKFYLSQSKFKKKSYIASLLVEF